MKKDIFDLKTEKALIAELVIHPESFTELDSNLKKEDFYFEKNAILFDILNDLFLQGRKPDTVTLVNELKARNLQQAAGDFEYIGDVLDSAELSPNIKEHAKSIKRYSMLRQLGQAGQSTVNAVKSLTQDPETIIDNLEDELFGIMQASSKAQKSVHIKDVAINVMEDIYNTMQHQGELTGCPTGFEKLNKLTNGFQKQDLIILGARPSMGKTAFALNLASNASGLGKTVLIFSLEMSREQLVKRMLIANAKVTNEQVNTGQLRKQDFNHLYERANGLASRNIIINESGSMNVNEIRRETKRVLAKNNVDLVIIDYLQLISGDEKAYSRNDQVAKISKGLKAMAKELNVPVLVLSQLSRGCEMRSDKTPQLSDLRDSGAIEQDADLVMFLHREAYYDKNADERDAELIIAKQRNGPIDTIDLSWYADKNRFVE